MDEQRVLPMHEIRELERELEVRRKVYPGWVQSGKLSAREADHRLICLESAIFSLRQFHASDKAGYGIDPQKADRALSRLMKVKKDWNYIQSCIISLGFWTGKDAEEVLAGFDMLTSFLRQAKNGVVDGSRIGVQGDLFSGK